MGYQPITRLPECIKKYSVDIRVHNIDRKVVQLNCKQRAQYNHWLQLSCGWPDLPVGWPAAHPAWLDSAVVAGV